MAGLVHLSRPPLILGPQSCKDPQRIVWTEVWKRKGPGSSINSRPDGKAGCHMMGCRWCGKALSSSGTPGYPADGLLLIWTLLPDYVCPFFLILNIGNILLTVPCSSNMLIYWQLRSTDDSCPKISFLSKRMGLWMKRNVNKRLLNKGSFCSVMLFLICRTVEETWRPSQRKWSNHSHELQLHSSCPLSTRARNPTQAQMHVCIHARTSTHMKTHTQ